MEMPRLTHGNQRGQSVANHRQTQEGKKLMRTGGQLERQGRHPFPGVVALPKPSGQGAHGQNRRRKSSVLAIAANEGRDERGVMGAAGFFGNPLLSGGKGAAIPFVCAGGRAERPPPEHGCAKVAEAEEGTPPPAVSVGVSREPV